MPRINLLPWREELRQKRKKDFMLAMLGAVLLGGLLTYGYKLTVEAQISNQNARNALLRSEIASLNKQIKQISGLEAQKERLLARMKIIDQLQRSRPEVVHLFDELVKTLPDGVYLTDVSQKGARITLKGAAQSSTRVSALMRNIEASKWLKNPGLDVIKTNDKDKTKTADFTVYADEVSLTDEDADSGDKQAANHATSVHRKRVVHQKRARK